MRRTSLVNVTRAGLADCLPHDLGVVLSQFNLTTAIKLGWPTAALTALSEKINQVFWEFDLHKSFLFCRWVEQYQNPPYDARVICRNIFRHEKPRRCVGATPGRGIYLLVCGV